MKYTFAARGHPNIRAAHPATLEFTREPQVSERGDCIAAVDADFALSALRRFAHQTGVTITIAAEGVSDTITAQPNPDFSDAREMVVRMSEFRSPRTFAINADKAACHLKKELKGRLAKEGARVTVTIS